MSASGKTTLASRVAKELKDGGVKTQWYRGKSLFLENQPKWLQRCNFISSVFKRPFQLGRVILELARVIIDGKLINGDTRYKLQVFLKWARRFPIRINSLNKQSEPGRVNLLDRGICTDLLGIITRIDINDIEALGLSLAAAGAFPDIIVVCHASPEVLSERRENRGDQKKFWQNSIEYETHKFFLMLELAERIVISRGGKVISVRSDNEGINSENIDKIANDITSLFKEQNAKVTE